MLLFQKENNPTFRITPEDKVFSRISKPSPPCPHSRPLVHRGRTGDRLEVHTELATASPLLRRLQEKASETKVTIIYWRIDRITNRSQSTPSSNGLRSITSITSNIHMSTNKNIYWDLWKKSLYYKTKVMIDYTAIFLGWIEMIELLLLITSGINQSHQDDTDRAKNFVTKKQLYRIVNAYIDCFIIMLNIETLEDRWDIPEIFRDKFDINPSPPSPQL